MKPIPEVFYYRPAPWTDTQYEVRTRKNDHFVCMTQTEAKAAHIVRALNNHTEEHSPMKECCGPVCCLVYSLGLSLIGGLLTAAIAYGVWLWRGL